jgi:hypothetical protein
VGEREEEREEKRQGEKKSHHSGLASTDLEIKIPYSKNDAKLNAYCTSNQM